MGSREEVLARIRLALGPGDDDDKAAPHEAAPDGAAQAGAAQAGAVGYRTHSDLSRLRLLGLLTERLRDYGCNVRYCVADQLPDVIAAALTERGAGRVVVPAGLDLVGLPDGVELLVDDGLTAQELDAVDGVVTLAAVAIAETGTIVLDGTGGQGRRALTLIPDYHLCIVRGSQVVGFVTEAIESLRPDGPLTWISGPSATSDIELDRVQGVHGPRTLEVILISDVPAEPVA